jgi:hypothetical protein
MKATRYIIESVDGKRVCTNKKDRKTVQWSELKGRIPTLYYNVAAAQYRLEQDFSDGFKIVKVSIEINLHPEYDVLKDLN